MSAAGDAVLAEAYRWLGTTEQPPGSNGGPWWDPWGTNYGSWCAAFVSMVVNNALGAGTMCAVDGSPGFMLVSNGNVHAFQTGYAGSPTGLEAQRTPDLEPGDVVNYSWEAWRWEGTPGQGGYPVCDGGAYDGWPAGDHTGIVSVPPDAGGYLIAVEGNTSVNGSQDNGGAVLERTRHISQVCGWWRPVNYGAETGGPSPQPEEDDDMYQPLRISEGQYAGRIYLCAGSFAVYCGDPAIIDNMQRRGYCKPTIDVNEWDIYNAYQIVGPSGQGAM